MESPQAGAGWGVFVDGEEPLDPEDESLEDDEEDEEGESEDEEPVESPPEEELDEVESAGAFRLSVR